MPNPFFAPNVVTSLGGDLEAMVPGHLADYGIRLDGCRLFIALVSDDRVTAAGRVVSFVPGDAARLEFEFAALGTPVVGLTVATGKGEASRNFGADSLKSIRVRFMSPDQPPWVGSASCSCAK